MGCLSSKLDTVSSSTRETNVPRKISAKKETKAKNTVKRKKVEKGKSYQYEKIDEHARKAPNSLKNSPEDLVKYMSTFSKDPRMLARGFFVWISENIRYDVNGYFGRATRSPCDAASVMKGGNSVCEGYANVMELLCRQAEVPVKTISGYAKGISHSAANPFALDTDTNHAWNAVQLEGKWYMVDSTWGAGHLDTSNSFQKTFEEFYFLTDPKQIIYSHFPYMDKNMDESKKWQLLKKPVSLDEFNKKVKVKPTAFKLGAQAVSHQQGHFDMKNEVQMTFKSVGEEQIIFSARLMLKEGNMLREQPNATFGYPENKRFKLLVHPPKPGTYRMNVFGQNISDKNNQSIPEIMEYSINCTEVKEKDFEYPKAYSMAGCKECILHEPLKGNLPANSEVKFRVTAPHLQYVMVEQTFLVKSGTSFTGNVLTFSKGYQISLYGTTGEKYSRMDGLFKFYTV